MQEETNTQNQGPISETTQMSNMSPNAGMKVIQPISSSDQLEQATIPVPTSVAQSQAVSSAGSADSAPTQPVQTAQPASVYPTPQGTPPISQPLSSLYPTPGQTPPPNIASAAANSSNNSAIITGVAILGGLIALVASGSLLAWINSTTVPGVNAGARIIALLISGGSLLLGIGIIMRREIARVIYVFLAGVALLFSVFSIYGYLSAVHSEHRISQATVTSIDKVIQQTEANSGLSALQKAAIVQQLQRNESAAKADFLGATATRAFTSALVGDVVVTVLPLIFLTRPRVKAVFS